ncbi:primosomal protein N' [Seongchinamella sediminis]|uniref:Replication restart protein PriA n=1 Tax=Seongchinamella sediminis TaxID=2283635 RepID=A0A3L7E4N3_9GAMM|nr:primosomal protein N' [Seongchinamella sediminis]RLQ23491.1 primosomal protein N' [Seongchinamella sediminis]
MPVLRLAIPTPLRTLFDYLPPEDTPDGEWLPGTRFLVPFGRREMVAYLVEQVAHSDVDPQAMKRALRALDPCPLPTPAMLALCAWAASYYQHPPGEVYQAAFPRALRKGEDHRANVEPGWQLTTRGKGLPHGALARSPKQSRALGLLQDSGQLANSGFRAAGIGAAILRALEQKGLAERCELSAAPVTARAAAGLELNPEQAEALQQVLAAGTGFSCHLLEGVTGSGKTEVYLQLIATCLQQGRQALVLIPEIGLTPQTLSRFRDRFQAEIAVLHSGLSDRQRYRAWEAARSGAAHIVIGTRSAVFTSLARPGLIVVDEEHDASYKQQDGFRYSARDVAVKRGQLEQCPVVLGSATPSLESLYNALRGRYSHQRLRQRAGASELPVLRAIDIRRAPLEAGFSTELLRAVAGTLAAGQQVLLFLNRRGYAPTVQCHDCGWVADCRACDARLTLHRRQRRLRCHHCGASQPLPGHCPSCRSEQLLSLGLGTEKAEEFLRQRFPAAPVYRVDSDSMQGRESMQGLVEQVNGGEPCILLGTQMLTKGHHFPAVALVGVLDLDGMLFSTDFRGEERCAQLLTQVAGRAGRAEAAGTVLLQTHHPDHPGLLAMLSLDYHQQALAMLQAREQSRLPPRGQLLLVRTDCQDAEYGDQFLRDLRQRCAGQLSPGIDLIGPLPAPMQRRAGRFRSQLLVHCDQRQQAQQAARLLVAQAQLLRAGKGLNWSLDVDPQDMF